MDGVGHTTKNKDGTDEPMKMNGGKESRAVEASRVGNGGGEDWRVCV